MLGGTKENFWRCPNGPSGQRGGVSRFQFPNLAIYYSLIFISYTYACPTKWLWKSKFFFALKCFKKHKGIQKPWGILVERSSSLVLSEVFQISGHTTLRYWTLILPYIAVLTSVWSWVQRHKSKQINVLSESYHYD